MRKMIVLACAVLVSLCLCIPAMGAASSPDRNVKPEEGTIVKNDGTTVDISDPEELAEYLDLREASVPPENIQGYAAVNSFDVTLPPDAASAEVVMYVPGVKKGDVVMVRIMVDGQWVNVEAVVVDDNKVKMKLLYSGTVEILKLSSGQEPGDEPGSNDKPGNNSSGNTGDGADSGKNTSGVSPKTGESMAFPAACILGVLAGGTALAAGYKAKKITK